MTKGYLIANIALGVVSMACAVVSTVDQIKNGDRRAEIQGRACGEAIANRAEAGKWFIVCGVAYDETGKRIG